MEYSHALRACPSRQLAGLAASQVTASGCSASVLFQECSLDIEVVCVATDRDDPFCICRMVSGIGHIRDPLPGADVERMLAQQAEHDCATWPDLDQRLVRCAGPDRALGTIEPGANFESHGVQSLA